MRLEIGRVRFVSGIFAALLVCGRAAMGQTAAPDPFAIAPSLSAQAVFSCTDVRIEGTVDSAGSDPRASHQGHVVSNGRVVVSGNALIDGNATAGPGQSVIVNGNGRVTGTRQAATTAAPCRPIDLAALETELRSHNDNGTIPRSARGRTVLGGASGADFSLEANDSLTLPAGRFYFTSFRINGNANLAIGGPVRILCTGDATFNGNANIAGHTPFEFVFFSYGRRLAVTSGSSAGGFFYAPDADAKVAGSGLIIGGLFAGSVAVDGNGRVTRQADLSIPVVTLTDPIAGSIPPDFSSISVRGSASDGDSPVTVTVNGRSVTVQSDQSFTTTADLRGVDPPVITAVASDAVGNRSTATVRLCPGPPTVALGSPPPGSLLRTSIVDVSGTFSNATSVTVNGKAAGLSDTTFSATGVNLGGDGDRVLTIVASGSCGTATINPTVTVDTLPPAFSNLRPDANTVLGTRTVLFTGNVSPDSVSVTVAGRAATLSGGSFSVPNLALAEGANPLLLSAVDRAGNVATLTYTLTVDTVPPIVAITAPADRSVTRDSSISVSGTVMDASAVTVTVNSVSASTPTGMRTLSAQRRADVSSFAISGVPLAEGSNTIRATARDAAGNAGDAAITVDRDTSPPVIAVLDGTREIRDGDLLNHHPSPAVAVADAHLSSSTALLNGAPFSSGTYIPSDGTFVLAVTANDAAGNTATKTIRFTVDTVPPRIANVSPMDGSLVSSSPGPVSGDCDDSVSVTVNGIAAAVSSGHFRIDAFAFAEGTTTLTIVGRDAAGNAGIAVVAVTVDTQPPVVTIDSPTSGTYIRTPTVTVTGTATDVNLSSVTVNGVAAALVPGGSYSATVALAEGPATVTARATDRGNRTGSALVTVVADRTPPQITVTESGTAVSDAAIFRTHPQIVYGATDANPVTVRATLNGAAFVSGTTINGDGTYALQVDASDAAGNTATRNVSFTVDGSPPALTNLQPASGTVTRQTSIAISGDCDDAVSVTVSGIAASVSGSHFVAAGVSLSEGSNSIPLLARDRAGNETTATLTLVRDTVPPQVSITSPAADLLTSAVTVQVSGTATDEHLAGVDVNGGAAQTSGTSYSRLVPLVDGPNTITATARDSAGNTAEARVNVTRDSTAPAVTITSPTDGAVVGLPSTDVSGDAADAHLDRVTVNGVVALVSGSHFVATAVPLTAGANTLTATALDRAGNSSTASVRVTRDDTAVSISIDTPTPGARLRSQPILVSGLVSSAAVTVTVNGVAATISGGRFTATAVSLNEGSNTLTARATDAGGRTGVATSTVFLDTASPVITSVTPGADSVDVLTGVVIRILFSEAIDPATATPSSVTLSADAGGSPIAGTLSVSGAEVDLVPLTALAEHTVYRLTLSTGITDLAGNALAQPFVSRFTTGAAGVPATPVLDPVQASLCATSVVLSGSADPGARIRVTGGATIATTIVGPDRRFSISVDLAPDQVNALEVVAMDAQGRSSVPASASIRADCTAPIVQSARINGSDLLISFSEAMDTSTVRLGTDGSVSLDAGGTELGSSLTISSDGMTARVAGIRSLSGETFTLAVNRNAKDVAGNPLLAPFSQTFVAGGAVGLIGEVYDDAVGRPLAGAAVTVISINGALPPDPAPAATTDADGRFGLVVPAGEIVLEATRDGYTSVSRTEAVRAGEVTTVFDLRVSPLLSTAAAADGSAAISDTDLSVSLPAGSVSAGSTVRAASLLPQGLPLLPPLGWSPIAAAWLDLGPPPSRSSALRSLSALTLTATATWKNRFGIPPGATVLLARFDAITRRYIPMGLASLSADAISITAVFPSTGAFVLFTADPDALAPPPAIVEQPLTGVTPPDTSPITSATVTTDPPAVLPTQTAQVTATLDLSAAVPSGYPVQALVSETLTLLDGRTVQVPSFISDLIVVRDGAGHAVVPFRVRPSETAASLAISVGYENLQIKQYPFEVRRGDLISSGGGVIPGAGGFSLAVPAGALTEPVPVNLSPVASANLPAPIPDGFSFLAAIQISLGGRALSIPASLRWATTADPTAGGLIWAEVTSIAGIVRLQFVAPGRWNVANGWVETVPGDVHLLPVPGIAHGGLYVLLASASPLAYAKGVVLDIGPTPLPAATVTQNASAIVSLSNASGNYGLPVPAAGTTVRCRRTDTGNQGSVAVPVQTAGATAVANIQIQVTAPYVTGVSPLSSSPLPLDLPVVFTLSEPLDPATVSPASVTAVGPSGAIASAVTLSATGTQVTFKPTLPWPGKSSITLTLLSSVTDLNGYRLVDRSSRQIADFVVPYTTVDPTPPGDVNPLLILMTTPQGTPSATTITGGPGAACAGCTVTAINETTQATASTQALSDGSFSVTLLATPTDIVSISVQRPGGGGEIKLNPGPFRSDGGRTALVGSRAADFVTPDRIRVTLPDGTFRSPVTLRVNPIAEAALPASVPSLATFMGAVSFDAADAVADRPIDIGIAAPDGVTGGTFLVARAVKVFGETRWMVVDTARYDNGEITTRPAGAATSSVNPLRGMLLSPAGSRQTLEIFEGAKVLLDRITRTSNLVFLELTREFGFLQAAIQTPNCVVSFTFSAQYDYLSSFIPFVWVAREAKQQTYFLVPIPTNADYTLNVRDSTTGFTIFEGNFSGVTDPTNITQLPPGSTKGDLPAPRLISGAPFQAITFTPVPTSAGEKRLLLPGVEYEFAVDGTGRGSLRLSGSAGGLPANVKVTLYANLDLALANGKTDDAGVFGPLSVAAKLGQDVTFVAGSRSLGLDSRLRLGFSEPFTADTLKAAITLVDEDGAGDVPFDVVPDTEGSDGSRPFTIIPLVRFVRGHRITLRLAGGVGAAQATTGKPLSQSIDIEMFTPKDDAIGVRAVNDVNALYLKGGLLLEATADSMLNLYDASDPGHVLPTPCSSKPLASPARGLTMDEHQRILVAMGGGGTVGRLQVFRLGTGGSGCRGRTLIDEEELSLSYTDVTAATGTNASSLPEGFPRTVRLFNIDQREQFVVDRDQPNFVTLVETPPGGLQRRDSPVHVTGTIPPGLGPSVLNQPATLVNRTTGASWTSYATDLSGAFSLDGRASSGDRLEIILNAVEIGVIGTLSFGIQGVEVNRTMHKPGQSCDPAVAGENVCPLKNRLLFSFGGKADAFGSPPAVQFCREPDVHAGSACVDLITDLERLSDIDLLAPSSGVAVAPSGQAVVVGAISRFGLGLFAIAPISGGYQMRQVGDGVKLADNSTIPAVMPPLFAIAAARDWPVRPPDERKSCLASKWSGYKPSLAFVAAGASGVFVVDVTDALHPEKIGLFHVSDSSAQANSISLDSQRGLVYVGMGGEGVAVYDMTDPCTLGPALPSDPRVISRIPVSNVNVNVPFAVDPDMGILFGAGDPGDGAPPGSGKEFQLAPVDPPLRFVADTDRDGVFEEASSAIPLGVTNPQATGPRPPAIVRLLANIAGGAGPSIVLPIASTSETRVAVPPAWSGMPRTRAYIALKQQSGDPADPGYNRYLSPPIVLVADARARKGYNLAKREDSSAPEGSDNENSCRNCRAGSDYDNELADLVSPLPPTADGHDPDHPITSSFEQFTGRKLVAGFDDPTAAAVKARVSYLKDTDLLRVKAELRTVTGDLSPTLAQLPSANPSVVADETGTRVVLSSGELLAHASDLFIAGREGNDFAVERFYASGAIHFGPLGQNWDSPLFARLRDLPSGDVEYYDGTMRRETFRYDVPSGTFVPPPGRFAELYRLPDRSFFLIERDKSTLRFDEEGRLISISDRVRTSESEEVGDGNRIRFFYDGAGRLTLVTDSLAHSIRFAYYASDNTPGANGAYPDLLKSVRDHMDRTVYYGYDARGRLISVALPNVSDNGGGPVFSGVDQAIGSDSRRRITYTYAEPTDSSNLRVVLHESNNLIRVTNLRGHEALSAEFGDRFGFDAREAVVTRRIAGIPEAFDYLTASHTASFRDRRGHDWKFEHDEDGHALATTLQANDLADANTPGTVPAIAIAEGVVPVGPFKTTNTYKDSGNRHHDGLLDVMTLPSGRTVSYGYETASGDRRNRANVTEETANGPGAPRPLTEKFTYWPLLNAVKTHTDATGSPTAATTFERDPAKGFVTRVKLPLTQDIDGTPKAPSLLLPRDVSTGQLQEATDAVGIRQEYSYFDRNSPAYGYLRSVTTTGNSSPDYRGAPDSIVRYERDARGNLVSVTDGREVKTLYTVNEADQVVKIVQAADSPDPKVPALSIERTFQYDADGNLVLESWPQTIAATTVVVTRAHKYDDLGHRVETTEAAGAPEAATLRIQYDSLGQPVLITRPEGERDVSAYDARGLLVAQKRIASDGELASSVHSYTRDEDGRIRVDFDGVNTRLLVDYDAYGRTSRITTPRQAVVSVEYDSANRPTRITVKSPGGQTLKERRTEYAANGQTTKEAAVLDPDGAATESAIRYGYDEGGRLRKTTDPLDRPTLRFYDTHGRLAEIDDTAGNKIQIGYDAADNPVSRIASEISPDGVTYEVDRLESSEYDALNRMTRSLDPLSHETKQQYDEPGNVLSVADALSHVTSYGYDRRGRLVSMTDPRQKTTSWSWDRDSRVISMTDANGPPHTTIYRYNTIGRLREIDYPDGNQETRSYNGDGTIATMTNQNKITASFSYDLDDQPKGISYGPPLGQTLSGVTQEKFRYDDLGRLTSASTDAGVGNSAHVLSRTYDSLDRIVNEAQDGDANAIARVFDLVGNPTRTSFAASSRSFTRTYDGLNRLSRLEEDVSGTKRLIRSFDYFGFDRRATETGPMGRIARYGYDPARRLTSITATDTSTSSDFLNYVFGWADDNVPTFAQRLHEAGRGDAFTHDEDHRLTLAALSQPNPTVSPDPLNPNRESFTLGPVHERTQEILTLAGTSTIKDVTSNMRYGYTSYGGISRTYDAAGNLTTRGADTFKWDARNRLVEANLGDVKLEFGYDALGRRVEKKKTVSGTSSVTKYIYEGWNVAQEIVAGALFRETVYAAGLDSAVECRIFGSPNHDYEIYRDDTGSTAGVVSDAGTTAVFKYLPFGKPSTLTPGSPDYNFDLGAATTFSLWQGLEFDSDLGWYYARNRWYDPETASFASADPLGYPESANAYAWGLSAPWPRDPSGLIGIFFDGTWNDKDKPGAAAERTNIARLYQLYRQRSYYVTGVGTGMGSFLGVIAGAFGIGADEKVEEAYWQVAKAYKSGDHAIDIFGFSRGAVEARQLASLIRARGILDPDYFLTKTIRTNEGELEIKVRGQRQIAAGKDVSIRFLGVFDTVPGGYLHGSTASGELAVPEIVGNARQARAADEHRTSFGLVGLRDPRCKSTGHISEKTFRGAHSDVGGGYPDGFLYKLPLEWMWSEARRSGVPFADLDPGDRPSESLKALPESSSILGSAAHDSRNAFKDPLGALMPEGVYTRDITYPGGCR